MTDDAPAPATYYAATAVPQRPRPRLLTEVDAAVCIVGGGFAGLWTARALARRGYDVVVLDAGRIAGQASGRNGGFVSAGYAERLSRIIERVGLDHARALYALSREGVELVRAAIGQGMPGVDPLPGRLNVLRHDDADGLLRQADLLARFGHEVQAWPVKRVRETLASGRYYQALEEPDAFSIHPLNLALALAAEIENHGGRIYEDSMAIDADLAGVRKWVATSGGRVRAHQIVFCGSAFIGKVFPALARTILLVATHVGVTQPLGEKLGESIRYAGAIADTRRAGDYYRVVGDRLLWGGRITTRTAPPPRLKQLIARDLASVYPQLEGVAMDYAWSGIMGYAIHRMPQIGELQPGVWIASGFGGHGLNTTAMAAELITGAIVENDDRWRLFIPFGLVWAGGPVGRAAAQLVYWSMQIRDKIDEARSRRAERKHERRRAAEAARTPAAGKPKPAAGAVRIVKDDMA
jgi:gamma-glutamylputrescine oxidase